MRNARLIWGARFHFNRLRRFQLFLSEWSE